MPVDYFTSYYLLSSVADQNSRAYIFVFQQASSLFLKQFIDGAHTISSGKLFHSETTCWLK